MIPICFVKDKKFHTILIGKEIDKPKLCIAIGSNGAFFLNENVGHCVCRPVSNELVGFDKIEEEVSFHYPIISFEIYQKSLCFLREIYREHQSEANILLVLERGVSFEEQEYEIVIPKQKVGGASVDYDEGMGEVNEYLGEDKFLAGSIHSHPGFTAYQSGIDHQDEINFDGIHITLGQIADNTPEVHQRVCIGGVVYEPKGDLINTVPPIPEVEIPEEWKGKVEKQSYGKVQTYHYLNHGYEDFWNKDDNVIKTVKELLKEMKPIPQNQKSSNILEIIKGL
jgi:proteasome lid subunit RPN8/RPN11